MPRRIWGVLAITCLTSCASTAAPTPASTPDQPTAAALKPPLDSLAFYVGTWQCKGTYFATSDQPEKKWEATMKVEAELDGNWLSVQMIGPGPNRSKEHKGYDKASKKWIHLAVGNDGSWLLVTSPGWTGSQMVFALDDPNDKSRATFTKLSETSYSHVVTGENGQKDWEKICTKM